MFRFPVEVNKYSTFIFLTRARTQGGADCPKQKGAAAGLRLRGEEEGGRVGRFPWQLSPAADRWC